MRPEQWDIFKRAARLEKLEQASRLLDPEHFRRSKRYEFLRFRVPA